LGKVQADPGNMNTMDVDDVDADADDGGGEWRNEKDGTEKDGTEFNKK
jgi:hypothetical protein